MYRQVAAEQQVAEAIDSARFDVEIVHLGESKSRIGEAQSAGVTSVPALAIGEQPFHIDFGAAIADLKYGEITMKQLFLAALCAATSTAALAADPQVPYPQGYRDWHHVKSMVIEEGHPLYDSFGGIHHLYANDKAMNGYRKGTFSDGSVIIFDLLEAIHDGNAITEGARKVVGVMHKDAKKFAATGGWGFEGFGGGDRTNRVVGENAASACFACHTSQKAQDYTFSKLRD